MAKASGAQRPYSTGDIVSFFFPYAKSPRLKRRPCLIVHIDEATDEAVVAYGTSSFLKWLEPHSITVRDVSAVEACNLDRPTRFLLRRRVRVPLSDCRFAKNANGTAVFGHIRDAALELDKRYAALPLNTLAAERHGIHPPKQVVPPKRQGFLRLRRRGRDAVVL